MDQISTMYHEIASFATETNSLERLPAEVAEVSKKIMVNAAAAGLAGAAQQDGHTVTQFAQDMGGNGRCTIIGRGLRSSPVYASLVNAVLIRLLDFDDEIVANGAHPGGAIFPVVMALGEMNGLSGPKALTAFAVGCEVYSSLQTLATGKGSGGDVAIPEQSSSGTLSAALGATAAACMLLDLDESRTIKALRLAGAGGSPDGAGPDSAYAYGKSAMAGVMAALLTEQGLDAMPSLPPALTGSGKSLGLGSPFDILSPGTALKLYPCASQAHTAIDASLQLVQQYRFSADEIGEVKVGITPPALDSLPYPTPVNGWEARACISFIVASTLATGHPLIDSFSEQAVSDPQIRALMDRITVDASEEPTALIPYPSSVSIALRDGRRIHHRAEFARGLAEIPLTSEELNAKFLYCSRYILPPDHIEEAITRLRDLENIDNTTGLFSVLGG
ncbi:MAG: MmgE/PrpD family protein [Chloroflexota bacterium]|nr:MmgE/PrpD family protein [Chloroflexota bacterium]